ncbi:MAG: ATPase involved in chromosome partitioning-like protein, partial [Myxococcaceae bacterium]|nr:ATPase involved in chromosome partitioning-like protein [Myxococcaceae bacterium]
MEVGRSTTRMMLPALVQRTTMKLVRPSLPAPSAPPPPPIDPAPRSFWCTPDPRPVILCDPDSERASGFRVLRDGLLAKGLPRVLAVSSAWPGDGKTTCATNLALALAEQTRERLLLVDANFFAPSLASMFSIDEYATSAHGGPQAQPWCAP